MVLANIINVAMDCVCVPASCNSTCSQGQLGVYTMGVTVCCSLFARVLRLLSHMYRAPAGAQRKLQEDGQQLTDCTFAPKTGRPPREGGEVSPKQPFPERLYRRRDAKYAQVGTQGQQQVPEGRMYYTCWTQGSLDCAELAGHPSCSSTLTLVVRFKCVFAYCVAI